MQHNVLHKMSQMGRSYLAVVDDERDLMELFSQALHANGFKIKEFNDPLLALEDIFAYHLEYSMVLTDIRMPGMDGLHLSRLINQLDKEIKILCMSAYEIYNAELEEIHIDELIKKPVRVSELVKLITKHLAQTKINNSLTQAA